MALLNRPVSWTHLLQTYSRLKYNFCTRLSMIPQIFFYRIRGKKFFPKNFKIFNFLSLSVLLFKVIVFLKPGKIYKTLSKHSQVCEFLATKLWYVVLCSDIKYYLSYKIKMYIMPIRKYCN